MGMEPFAYLDIEAWARLSGEVPRPWEVRTIMAMDAARRAEYGRLTDPDRAGQIDASDAAGLRAMMRRVGGGRR